MNKNNYSTLAGALFLIILGGLFLALNLTGLTLRQSWPVIFFVLAVMFFLPAILWPEARKGLAALYIPGSIMFVLGLIFLYNVLTNDWVSWTFIWTLIPGSVGLGLITAGLIGGWGLEVRTVGYWMLGISVMVFAIFGALFGSMVLKVAGPALLVLGGVFFLVRSFRKSN
jgi:hypothetical protein